MDFIKKDEITYFPLYACCPVCNHPTPHRYWTHGNNCGGQIYIGNDGAFLCSKCNATSNVRNWKILSDCENTHENCMLIESSDRIDDIGPYVSFAGQMVQATGLAWLNECLPHIVLETKNN